MLSAVLLGLTLGRLVRRFDAGQRGYTVILAALLLMSLYAMGQESPFFGVVAVAMTGLVVVVPFLLELLARAAFGRGKLRVAVQLAGLRALLMPGSGLARHQEILHGLAVLERVGVDGAIDHFRGLAGDTDDDTELAIINEQIVSMLFYGQRWDEGIAHYDLHFHARYAAVRPALALGLMRAYGESGRLERAAELLLALENGPVGTDPRSLGLLSQARVTFLAYVGAAQTVANALTRERCRVLGISLASGALFRGIAWLRAGCPKPAQVEFERVERLATAADDRVVVASRRAIASLGSAGGSVELNADLVHYAESVAVRLDGFLRMAPTFQRTGTLLVVPALVVVVVWSYLIRTGLQMGGLGLLAAGAMTPALWRNGEWFRVFTGIWCQGDAVSVVVSAYTIWLCGPAFERIHGRGRTVVAGVGGGAVGLAAAAGVSSDPASVLAGGHLLASALAGGALWTLGPWSRTSVVPAMRKRVLAPMLLMLLAQALAAIPGLAALEVSPVGLITAAAWGMLVAMVPERGIGRSLRWAAIPLLVVVAASVILVARTDARAAYLAGPSQRILVGDRWLDLPPQFETVRERVVVKGLAIPLQPGAIDRLALRVGQQLQVVATPSDATVAIPSLLQLDPTLQHELHAVEAPTPTGFIAAYEQAGGNPDELRTVSLRRNGRAIALLIERRMGDEVRAIFASPPTALRPASDVLAGVLLTPGWFAAERPTLAGRGAGL